MPTLTVDNFRGSMTSYSFGDMNSGRGSAYTNAGQNPFTKPGQLTWADSPVQIDPTGSVITDLILDGKERIENNILYVYAIGHTGRLYKIQVNDPSSYNPNYDHPVLLATLSINTPTFTRGAFIDFCGTPEQIFIGHDKGITTIHYDGTAEAFLGVLGSYTATVPRPLKQFLGKLYAGNGSNLLEIDISGTGTVNTYAKLTPAFPTNTQVRDLDVSIDGNYLYAVVSRLALEDITSTVQSVNSSANSESYLFKWNGTDTGYTAFTTYPSFSLTANIIFQNYEYVFGYDQFGAAIFNPNEKFFFSTENISPLPNAIISSGNQVSWLNNVYYNGVLEVDMLTWGHLDFEIGNPLGFWDSFFLNATAPETDIIRSPCLLSVSNAGLGSSSNGYANNLFSSAKIYFSTLETSSAPTTKYRFYKWNPNASRNTPTTKALFQAYYQTQIQMFSKKISVSQTRIYGEPWPTGTSFQIDLIGSDGLPIVNGTNIFTEGVNIKAGDDYIWWGPDMKPTYCLGVAITNLGTANHTINKIEIDYNEAGQ